MMSGSPSPAITVVEACQQASLYDLAHGFRQLEYFQAYHQ